MDCVLGARKLLPDNSIDLIICDPPYGIDGDKLDRHYNRDESKVLSGYIEAPKDYFKFSCDWILEAERVLSKRGSMYIVSGYSHLKDILCALDKTKLNLVNHLIWKFNFGVFTKNKYVSSHYHILFLTKSKQYTFNTNCRFSSDEKTDRGRSLSYMDREDVFIINRENHPNEIKNKNQLPHALLSKLIAYSSNVGDTVCDFFLGSFGTAQVANEMGRHACGFELNEEAYKFGIEKMNLVSFGSKNETKKNENPYHNQGKRLTESEIDDIWCFYFDQIAANKISKKDAIAMASKKFGRGIFSIKNIIKRRESKNQNGK